MPRAIWKGDINFGLINIGVELYPAISTKRISFHLTDKRDGARIRYQRVNEETGEEVTWDQITKSYEYKKGNYIQLDKDTLDEFKPELTKSIELEEFISLEDISPLLFDKPYYLVPSKSSKKAYVLMREILKEQNKCGVGRVVIRTKEHIGVLLAIDNALVLNLLFFPDELRSMEDYNFPEAADYDSKIKAKEVELTHKLIESMTTDWNPAEYKNDYQEKLKEWIEKKLKDELPESTSAQQKDESDKVLSIEELLQKSLKKLNEKKAS